MTLLPGQRGLIAWAIITALLLALLLGHWPVWAYVLGGIMVAGLVVAALWWTGRP